MPKQVTLQDTDVVLSLEELMMLLRGQPRASEIEDFPKFLGLCAKAHTLLSVGVAEALQPTSLPVEVDGSGDDDGGTDLVLDIGEVKYYLRCGWPAPTTKTKEDKIRAALKKHLDFAHADCQDALQVGGVSFLWGPLTSDIRKAIELEIGLPLGPIEQFRVLGLSVVQAWTSSGATSGPHMSWDKKSGLVQALTHGHPWSKDEWVHFKYEAESATQEFKGQIRMPRGLFLEFLKCDWIKAPGNSTKVKILSGKKAN